MYLNDGKSNDPCEERANAFAADLLVPASHRGRLAGLRTYAQLESLAKELGIAPGIVAGQYQKHTDNYKLFNKARRSFEWSD